MQTPNRWKRIGLTRRAIALVTLALMPLGIIGVWQTDRILKEQQETADQALLSVTEQAAAREHQIIERVIGAATAMGDTAQSLAGDPSECTRAMRQFERSSPLYGSVAFLPAQGAAPCLTNASFDPAQDEALMALIDRQRLGIYATRDGVTPEEGAFLVVAVPTFRGNDYTGHFRLQTALESLEPAADGMQQGPRPLNLVTFNADGDILTSERRLSNALELLPEGGSLADLASEWPYALHGLSRDGQERGFAVVPLVPGTVYALGTWSSDLDILAFDQPYWLTIGLAVLMWLASIVVVSLIMQWLVIRGVQRLDRQLSRFRSRRQLPRGPIDGRGELYDLEESFRHLAETILRDEADLENAVHEKDVLLKEVHHRVKNNLQLINSIINMILRGARSPETRVVVRRLQDRVMALASVHRSIYQAQTMDRVDASEIAREIVNQSVAVGLPRGSAVDIETELAQVTLYPDQAMPLSMLVSEGVTNALKYVGGDHPRISVRLREVDAAADPGPEQDDVRKRVTLSIVNTVGATTADEDGTGLGALLLRAFAQQLEGQLRSDVRDGEHVLEVTFAVAGFSPEPQELPEEAA